MDDRNMPEDNDIGPFDYENDKNEPEHPKAWVTDRESDALPIMYTEAEVLQKLRDFYSEVWSSICVADVHYNVEPEGWWEKNRKK